MRRVLLAVLLTGTLALSQGFLHASAHFTDTAGNAGNTFTAIASWVFLHASAGVDATGTATNMSAGELTAIAIADDNRYDPRANWPSAYSDTKYLGLTFPDIPDSATVVKVLVIIEWSRMPQVSAGRLKVFDGLGNQQIYNLDLPEPNVDSEQKLNITSFINTAQKVNGLQIWFQATSSPSKSTKHDQIEVMVAYY